MHTTLVPSALPNTSPPQNQEVQFGWQLCVGPRFILSHLCAKQNPPLLLRCRHFRFLFSLCRCFILHNLRARTRRYTCVLLLLSLGHIDGVHIDADNWQRYRHLTQNGNFVDITPFALYCHPFTRWCVCVCVLLPWCILRFSTLTYCWSC